MKLGNPTPQYSAQDQAQMRSAIEQADDQNHKRTKNIEVGAKNAVIFNDTATGKRYKLQVTNGALALTGPL